MPDILHKVGIKSTSLNEVYKALATVDCLSRWWTSDTSGESKVGGTLQFRFGDGGFDMNVLELTPGKRVLWQVVDGPEEWLSTKISFDIKQNGDWTVVLFKHQGWKAPVEFMHHCSTKWAVFLLSLKSLLEAGKGAPWPNEIKIDTGIGFSPRVIAKLPASMEETMKESTRELGAPKIVDRATFEAELDALRVREKAHTREGDAIAAARRRLPVVEVNAATTLVGEHGPVKLLDAFEGRRILIAYYFMWHAAHPAAEQCEGCSLYTSQIRELSFLHSRDVTYAIVCQGPYEESARYRHFMGWELPWYSAPGESLDTLLVGRQVGLFHLVCYLRRGARVFETYWTTRRGVEPLGNSYALLDMTVYGRQEAWEESPAGWPQRPKDAHPYRDNGRPIVQWPRLKAGHSDDLETG